MIGIRRIGLHDKIWRDQRGWGSNPLEAAGLSGKPVGNLHMVSLNPGSVRGDHYHTETTEWLFVSGGPAKIAWKRLDEVTIHEIVIEEGGPALFEIPPLTGHAILNTGRREIFLLAFSDQGKRDTIASSPLFPNL